MFTEGLLSSFRVDFKDKAYHMMTSSTNGEQWQSEVACVVRLLFQVAYSRYSF